MTTSAFLELRADALNRSMQTKSFIEGVKSYIGGVEGKVHLPYEPVLDRDEVLSFEISVRGLPGDREFDATFEAVANERVLIGEAQMKMQKEWGPLFSYIKRAQNSIEQKFDELTEKLCLCVDELISMVQEIAVFQAELESKCREAERHMQKWSQLANSRELIERKLDFLCKVVKTRSLNPKLYSPHCDR